MIVLENVPLLIYIYLILIYLGIGIFSLISPTFLKKPYLYAVIAPGFGFCLLSIIGAWILSLNIAITWTIIVSFIIATILNSYALWKNNPKKIFSKMFTYRKNDIFKRLGATILSLIILLLLILPGMRDGQITTPIRIGPDAIFYAGAAQTLFDGGSLSTIESDLKAVTGKENLEEAKNLDLRLIRFDLLCSSEVLLKALRWGYPIILSNILWVSCQDNIYNLDFMLLIFSWAMLLGLIFYTCTIIIKARTFVCLILTAIFALNCNLLNVYYEGSYAQTLSMPILYTLLLMLWHIRKENNNDIPLTRKVIFIGFLFAGLISIYAEAAFCFLIICFLVLLLDFVFKNAKEKGWVVVLIASFSLAFCLITPLILKWFFFILNTNYLQFLGTSGWSQPCWATLPDILGWVNIYGHKQFWSSERDYAEILTVVTGSVLILGAGVYYIIANKKQDKAFWLAPFIFITMIFIKTFWVEHLHNYQYYKAYTFVLPLIYIFIYAAFFFIVQKYKSKLKFLLYGIIIVSVMLTTYNGLTYINRYIKESRYYTQDMYELKKHNEVLSGYVVMNTPYDQDLQKCDQMASVMKMNYYNIRYARLYGEPIITPYLDMNVAIILFDNEISKNLAKTDEIIYSGEHLIIVNSTHKLKDGIDKEGKLDINYFYQNNVLLP